MCLALPGKLIAKYQENNLIMGRFDYSGTVNTACLEYVPDIEIGQFALVHAGFAINIIDEQQAQASYAAWAEIVESAKAEGTDIFGLPLD